MLNSFRNRILLIFLFLSMGLMSILGISHYQSIRQFSMVNFENSARTLTKQIAQRAVVGVFSENFEHLAQIATEAFFIPNLTCLTFFNDRKKTLLHFHGAQCPHDELGEPGKNAKSSFSLINNHANVLVPVILEEFKAEGKQGKTSEKTIGYVSTCFSLTAIHKELTAVIWNLTLSEIIIALLFGFLIVFLEKWVSKPLIQLTEKVHQIAQGNLSTRVEILSKGDEISVLGQNINGMADSLQNYTNNLEKMLEEKTRAIEIRERQMMFQEKMASLGLMSANIAHEINNPLNYISLGLEYLENREKKLRLSEGSGLANDFPERQKVFADIRHGFKRMRDIIDSLKKFSRTDEGQIQEYSMKEVFEDALRIVQHEITSQNVNLQTDIQWTGMIYGSAIGIQQILLNFFRNSLDAFWEHKTPQPMIRFEVQEKEGQIQIHFTDNGPGIPAEYQERIFEPFFTTKPSGKGTGLGLSLCFELASREGGSAKLCQSNSNGTIFEVTLPLRKK